MLRNSLIALVIIVIVGAFLTLYTVTQTQEAILLRLGKVELDAKGQAIVVKPGLHMKMPFVETVERFDMRLRTLNIDSSRIMTAEQKDVLVDAYVKWRIADIVKYYTSTGGDPLKAQTLLQQKVNDGMRATFGQHTIPDLLSDKRIAVMKTILDEARQAAKQLGVQVVDVRIKRIDLPDEVAEKIYARMSSAREKIASQIRADGEQQAEIIRAKADANVTVTLAKAKSQAAAIRAAGDKKAAMIYAKAYQQDPRFYDFYRSLEAYQGVFNTKKDMIVLQPKGQFFKNFNALDPALLQAK